MIRLVETRFDSLLPYQHISFKDKTKNNFEWAMDCVDFYRSKLSWEEAGKRKNAYSWYNGEVDESEFTHITNPLAVDTKDTKYKGFPAKLKAFTIVTDIINTLITEWRNAPIHYQVKIINEDAVNEYKQMREKILLETYQDIYTKIVEQGDMTEEEMQQEIQKKTGTLPSLRAKEMQKALKYIEQEQEMFEKSCKAWKDFLIDGTAPTYKDIVNDDIVYEVVNPLYIQFDESSEYGQNGNYAVRRMGEEGEGLTFSEIHDLFKDEPLTKEEIDTLKKDYSTGANIYDNNMSYNPSYTPSYMVGLSSMRFPVVHCVWRSYAKKGVLTYLDPMTGEEQKLIVPEEYVAIKEEGEKVEWFWTDELWEGYVIGGTIYKKLRPYPYLRKKMQRGLSPLPYNNIYFSNRNAKNTSPLKMIIPYQIMAIIVFYNIEKAMANHIGNAMVIYMDEIPAHMQTEGMLYYLKSLNIIFKKRPLSGQSGAASTVNMSQMSEILQWVDFLSFIEDRAKRVFGITPQRQGQVNSSASNGATSMAIQQGQAVSGEMFGRFIEYQRQEKLGLMDLGRHSWLNGKKKEYLTSNDKEALLEIDGQNIDSEDLGLTVTSNRKDKDALDIMKNLVQPFAQNQQSPRAIGAILEADSSIELNEKLDEMEEEMNKKAQEAQKAEQEQIQQAQAMQEKMEETKQIFAMQMKEFDHNLKIDFARFEATLEASKLNPDNNNNELLKIAHESNTKKYIENVKAAASMYSSDKALEIAKENKTQFDSKPKTSKNKSKKK